MMNEFYVYLLIDPFNNRPFYVGKGKGDRAYAHTKGWANYNEDKLNYIDAIRGLGQEPEIRFLRTGLTSREALQIENFLIERFSYCLTNKRSIPPDKSGVVLTDEHKSKIRKALQGRKLTEEHKQKIGNSNTFVPNYNKGGSYEDNSSLRNEGSKNPRAKRIKVGDRVFNCMKHAYEFYGVSKQTFKKRFHYEILS